jgi:hypothetical protein
MQHLNIEVFSVLCAAYYEFEAVEVHFNELQPFASQVNIIFYIGWFV